MAQYQWVGYGGDARVELAVGLLAVAGGAIVAGMRLPLPYRLTRPGRAGTATLIVAWLTHFYPNGQIGL